MSQGTDLIFEKFRQNLALGEKPVVNIGGSFLRLSECAYPVTIRLLGDNGRVIGSMDNVLAGDYVRDLPFAGFVIENMSSAQFVSVQIASGAVGTDRVLGEVSVINGELAKVKANQSFIGIVNAPAVAGQYGMAQLWNPIGSGKNLIVNKLSIFALTAAGFYSVMKHNAQLTVFSTGASKMLSGPNSIGVMSNGSNATQLGSPLANFGVPVASDSKDFQFSEPLLIPPGNGIHIVTQAVNTGYWVTFQWNEENV